MKNNIKLLVIGAFCCVGLVDSAFAASNPANATETNSVGSSDLSVTIPTLYKISGIADLTTASYVGNGALTMNDDVCVYTNLAAGEYRVTLAGSSTCTGGSCLATNIFAIQSDANDQGIVYGAYWNDATTTTGRAQVGTDGSTSASIGVNQTGASASVTCGGGDNANFSVTMTEANLLAVYAGAYTGTLTITIIASV